AVIFGTDGVLTDTARIHAAAWKRVFGDLLRRLPGLSADQARPFDVRDDYLAHFDGRPRLEGAREFLASRGITPPSGSDGEGMLAEPAARKEELFPATAWPPSPPRWRSCASCAATGHGSPRSRPAATAPRSSPTRAWRA